MVHEEGSSAVMLQSVILCSPPLQSTVSLPILMGLSVTVAELQRQQQEYKDNVIYDELYLLHMTIETRLPIYIKFTYIYKHLHTLYTHVYTLKSCSRYTHRKSTQVMNYTTQPTTCDSVCTNPVL